MGIICRLCGQYKVEEVINFGNHPITKYLLTEQSQDFFKYPIVLCYCTHCSFIQLRDCIPPEILYGKQVNLSSWKNQPQIPQILDEIMNLSGLNGQSKILEIGCNDGSFLRELQRIGFKNLTGVDPGTEHSDDGIEYYQEYFSAGCDGEPFDLIVARHVLEHIEWLDTFGAQLRESCKEGTYLLIEVPDFEWFMRLSDYSGVWEEHVNYFTEHTLRSYLTKFGIEVLRTQKFEYSGQALFALCMYTGEVKQPEQYTEYAIRGYMNNWPQYRKRLRIAIEKCEHEIVVYGAGCRATSLINYTGIGDLISFVVDDQSEKQEKFLPGSRLPIHHPECLYGGDVSTILLAVNSENEEVVRNKHKYLSVQWSTLLPLSKDIIAI